mgnify:FL=1
MGLIFGFFKLLGGLLLLLLRLALPIAVIAFAIWLIRRGASGGAKHDTGGAAPRQDPKPHFKGPVMTVSYREVKDEKDSKSDKRYEKSDENGEGQA